MELGIKYHVNGPEIMSHPVIGPELVREDTTITDLAAQIPPAGEKPKRPPSLAKFERTIEKVYTQDMYSQCQRGLDRKARLREHEIGLFGLGTDWEKVDAINAEPIPACDELSRLGLYKK